MKAVVEKVGDSLKVTIPPEVAAELGLTEGSELKVTASGNTIRIRRADALTLDDLLKDCTPDKLHGEWDTGRPVGNEVW